MKKLMVNWLAGLLAGALGITDAAAAVAVQDLSNVVGTGEGVWSYLVLEGESFESQTNENPEAGFTRADATGAIASFLGNPILGPDTSASGGGALFTQTTFGQHIDKVTYKVQFAKPGTYYMYMRFTMFENGGNLAHYLNEDSFFLPPTFGKDPQTDWPLSDRGGYTEGCCDAAGFLYIAEKGGGGVRINHSADTNYWEGKFHWNSIVSSQFLNAETQGEPRVHFKYEVTAADVGKPLDFTLSYREGGVTIDLLLFSTNPNLIDEYSEDELTQLLVKSAVTTQKATDTVGTGNQAWSYLILEGEDYDSEKDPAEGLGFTRVDASDTRKSFLESPVLGSNTTASKKGALFTQTTFGQHIDNVTYKLQFAKPGTYYMYMRFTMFENGGNLAHYLNEDSFFLPPTFGKDPQTDWPLSDRGGYTEGCCDAAGFLYIAEKGGGGVRINHSADTNYWEGKFHWNSIVSSQFLNAETQGEPRVHFKYEVTAEDVGKPLDFTLSYREGGVTIDLLLFSTNPNLIDEYSEAELDQLLILPPAPAEPNLSVRRSGADVTLSWPSNATGYVLQSTASLTSADWSALAATPVVVDGQNTVTQSAGIGARYYRLKKP